MKTRPAGIGNVHADWMGSLPSKLSAMPLKHLAVPGESTKRKDIQSTEEGKCTVVMLTKNRPNPTLTPSITGGETLLIPSSPTDADGILSFFTLISCLISISIFNFPSPAAALPLFSRLSRLFHFLGGCACSRGPRSKGLC